MPNENIPLKAFRIDATDAVQLREASSADSVSSREFTGVALTDQVMDHWYFGKLAIDLSTLKASKQKMPVLYEHATPIGRTESLSNDGKALTVSGIIAKEIEDAKLVASLSQIGFPWQMSVGIRPKKIQRLAEGETATVNGNELVGPAAIFRNSRVDEVSICVFGVCSETSATILKAEDESVLVDVSAAGEHAMAKDNASAAGTSATETPAIDVNAVRKEAAAQALSDERQRIDAILKAAPPGCHELAQQMVRDGVSVADAALKFTAKASELLAEQAKQIEKLTTAASINTEKPPTVESGEASGGRKTRAGIIQAANVEFCDQDKARLSSANLTTVGAITSHRSFVNLALRDAGLDLLTDDECRAAGIKLG